MTEAMSVAAAYLGASTRASGASVVASAEAAAVLAAVLVDRSIGHLLPCRSSSVWLLVRFSRTYVGLYVGFLVD